jgi:hypothetical protein
MGYELEKAYEEDNARLAAELAEMKRIDNARIEECAQIPRLRAEIERLKADIVAAAGSDMSRVMLANAAMRRERDAANNELRELSEAVQAWHDADDDRTEEHDHMIAVLAKVKR